MTTYTVIFVDEFGLREIDVKGIEAAFAVGCQAEARGYKARITGPRGWVRF